MKERATDAKRMVTNCDGDILIFVFGRAFEFFIFIEKLSHQMELLQAFHNSLII